MYKYDDIIFRGKKAASIGQGGGNPQMIPIEYVWKTMSKIWSLYERHTMKFSVNINDMAIET